MSSLGAHLTLLIGQTVPVPAPMSFLEAFDSAEVTHSDEGRSGFQITFKVGRATTDVLDYALLSDPLLQPMNRVVLMVTFGAMPQVLMDGIITHQQLAPINQPGASTLTVTGEDVSVMMDLEEKSVEHPAQAESIIALKLIANYAQYGLIPKVIPPSSIDVPLPTERTPVQQATDLQYLQEMASRFGYVFYITPGPFPLTNTAYWGPPVREGVPQKAISINMGPNSNAEIPSFSHDGLATTFVSGQVQDRTTNEATPVQTFSSTRIPLVSRPDWSSQSHVRTTQLRHSGLNTSQAFARAQSQTDASTDRAVQVSGELDASRYEALLQPRGLVGLRGAGYSYDGLYYVRSVTHNIKKGEYKQRFALTREGVGAISPTVLA
jgi:hypothetical protein